jgi:hypothetical protein
MAATERYRKRKDRLMKLGLAKRFASVALTLGLAAGAFGLSSGTAFASTHQVHATKAADVKIGDPCTKAELGKVAKVGKVAKLTCVKEGKTYKYELVKK